MLEFSLNNVSMIHSLSVYKFRFPFIEYKYEQAICRESISDFKKMLMYKGIYLNTIVEKIDSYTNTVVYFIWWECQFYFNNKEVYYIPKYQCELYFDNISEPPLIKDIIKIFSTLGLHNYIFDYSNEVKVYMDNKNIITPEKLQESFILFNEEKIEEFLWWTHIKYLSETLKNNKQISSSFLCMIYNCYNFYQNYKKSEKQLKEMEEMKKIITNQEYSGMLELSSQRLKHINNINIVTFKKYSQILDSFFSLLR
jgi:hypothetical protein